MPTKSRKQFRLMKAVESGDAKLSGLSPEKAKEMTAGQSQAGLPERYRQAKPHRKRDWRFK